MIILRLFLALALPLLLGYCAVAVIVRNCIKLSVLERFALAWGIGIGLLGMEMFALSLAGVRLNLFSATLPAVVFILVVSAMLFRNLRLNAAVPDLKKINAAQAVLILALALVTLYVFFDALVKPIVNYDALWRQGTIARIIFTQGRVLTPQAVDLAGPHPYLNPLSQAWVYMGIGEWNDALGKVVFPLCFLSLLLIFYSNIRRELSRTRALLFTVLLTSFPLIVFHAGTAYSDFMQTFYYSSGALYLFSWMRRREMPFLFFAAIFLGVGSFVKQAGIPLWGVASMVLFLYIFLEAKDKIRSGVNFLLLSIAAASPWLFYQMGKKLFMVFGKAAVTGDAVALSQKAPPALQDILYHLGRRMFTYADWQILWFAVILVLLFRGKEIWKSELKYLALIILLNLAMIVYAFSEPTTYPFLVDGTLVNRVMMYQIPVVLYFVGVTWKEKL